MPFEIEKIVSGGQTGADRAALDAAMELGIPIGGWIPKGRLAEDGPIAGEYSSLRETETSAYPERTDLNVRNSDCTLIFSRGELTGGSLLTFELAKRYGKPVLHIDLSESDTEDAVRGLRNWLGSTGCRVLNVAGPRASSDPGIYAAVRNVLAALFSGPA